MKRKAVCVCACLLLAGIACADDPAPIVWFTMDEVAEAGGVRKIADASGNGRDLTLGGGCWLTNGTGRASTLFFNGTTAAFGTFASPKMDSRTVSMLFRKELDNGPQYEPGTNTYPYILSALSKQMRIHTGTIPNATTGYDIYSVYAMSESSNPIINGQPMMLRAEWHHLAWTYEQTPTENESVPNEVTAVCRFYRDGFLVLTSSVRTYTNTSVAATAMLGNEEGTARGRPIHG